jgi:hypothetical protein
VLCELRAEVGALEACKPESAGRDSGIGASDHLELEVGDDSGERRGRIGEEGAGAEAADLFRAEEGEDDGAFGTRAGGEYVSESEDCSGARGVVICSVVDFVAIDGDCGYAKMIEMCGKEDDFVLEFWIGAAEDGDCVPGLFAISVFEL